MFYLVFYGQEIFIISKMSILAAGSMPSFLSLGTSSSSVGATARCGLWPVEQYHSIFSYLSPTLSIFSLPTLEDLFLLLHFLWVLVNPFLGVKQLGASV
jgi:hypothetical protein